jgi:hypothetical protein
VRTPPPRRRALRAPAGAAAGAVRLTPAIAAAALCAAAAAAGACATKSALVPPRPVADGVAPWTVPDRPVVLCEAPLVRVVAPGPGGVTPRIAGACVAPTLAAPAPDCAGDADCNRRERCLCGACFAALCTSDDDSPCGAALSCVQSSPTNSTVKRCLPPCAADADCGAGETCDEQADGNRACVGTCDADTACARGERCNGSGRCVVSLCDSVDTACSGGLTCAVQGAPGLAAAPSALAAAVDLAPFGGGQGEGVSLYFARDGALYGAASLDGFTFFIAGQDAGGAPPPAPLAAPASAWEGAALGGPSVAVGDDGALRLYYDAGDGAGIGLLVAAGDGTFARAGPAPVLAAADSFEGTAVRAPAILRDGLSGDWLLFYEGGAGAGIGVARSPDGASFTPAPAPVLTPADVEDPVYWHDVTRVGAPFAAFEVDAAGAPRYRLWFAALGIESGDALFMGMTDPAQPNESIGYAESRDAAVFTPYPFDPVFDRPVAAVNHLREDQPTLVRRGSAFWLYFDARDESGTDADGIGVAIQD